MLATVLLKNLTFEVIILETRKNKLIVIWLKTGLFLVVLMVLIGGITRLTHSGLSMVEWKLIGGTVPPLNEKAWQETFEKYQQFPEYQAYNQGMTLSEFKKIFFWEYLHRLLGRLMGIIFIIPFVYFLAKKWVDKALGKKLTILLLGGALQAGLGWFMVKSGLVDRPSVSHFRLAIHLVAAFSLIVYIFWLILDLKKVERKSAPQIFWLSMGMLALTTLQIVYGAFTAGLKAGFICPTFPDMCGHFFPHSIQTLDFINHPANIQFLHRIFAWLLFFYAIYLWKRVKASTLENRSGNLLLLALCIQFLLGVATLLLLMPMTLALIHQIGAIFVLLSLINIIYRSSL